MKRPFLKWAGGKSRLINNQIKLPKGGRLIEPFVGGGSVFLNTTYRTHIIGDNNLDLINLYITLLSMRYNFINNAKQLFTAENNQRQKYNKLRVQFNDPTANAEDSAMLFLYLNRHGFNGLCRYNKSGKFNVPFGRYASPYFPENEMMGFLGKLLFGDVYLYCQDFTETMALAEAGDVVYCDPPYSPISPTANFTTYSVGGFTANDHQTLANTALELSHRGVTVVISNHDTTETRKLYQDAVITSFPVSRHISCKGNSRVPVMELTATYHAK